MCIARSIRRCHDERHILTSRSHPVGSRELEHRVVGLSLHGSLFLPYGGQAVRSPRCAERQQTNDFNYLPPAFRSPEVRFSGRFGQGCFPGTSHVWVALAGPHPLRCVCVGVFA